MIVIAVITSALSVVICIATFADALIDLRDVLREKIGNGRLVYAKAQVRRESLRLVSLLLLLMFSIGALVNIETLSWFGVRMTVLYITVQLLIVTNSMLDLWLNLRVRRFFRLRMRRASDRRQK